MNNPATKKQTALIQWLEPVITDPMKLKREAAKRRKSHKEKSVTKSTTADYLGDGWTVDRELKTKNRIRKPWMHDERLENRVWHLFYLLGYPEISGGRNFQITIKRRGAAAYRKQVDVLAKDDETVVVAECKSSERTTRRSLQKDIEEFDQDRPDAYWNKGVIDKKIKTRACEKSLDDDDDDRLPLENYLDFIEYKKIVEHKTHWGLFKELFDIPEPGEKGYSKNVRWMERINELRRIPAHPTEKRGYKVGDFEYIDYIHNEFTSRLYENGRLDSLEV